VHSFGELPPKGITFCPEPEKFKNPIIIPPAFITGAEIFDQATVFRTKD